MILHRLTALATAAVFSVWGAAVASDTTPPAARWISPPRHGVIRTDTIRVAVEAVDSGSGIAKVVFFASERDSAGRIVARHPIGERSSPPYGLLWDVSHVPDQPFMKLLLFCEITDSAGNVNRRPEGSRGPEKGAGWWNLFVLDRNVALSDSLLVSRRTRHRVAIDGRLDEWPSTDSVVLCVNENRFVVRSLWDRECLYIGAATRDTSVLLNDGSSGIHHPLGPGGDDIEFFLDPDHNRTEILTVPDTYYRGLLPRRVNRVIIDTNYYYEPHAETQIEWATTIRGTANDSTDRDTGWTLEAAIPWYELGVNRPATGDTIGLDINCGDLDDFSAQGSWVVWSMHPAGGMGNPSEWGNLVLAGSANWAAIIWTITVMVIVAAALLLAAGVLRRRPTGPLAVGTVSREEIRKALQIIAERYQDPGLSRNEIANEVALSVSHFSFLFHRECGMSFVVYVRQYRINRAKLLLLNTARTVSQVAFDVGFQDLAYFSRAFREETGMTPQDFRKSNAPRLS